MKNIMKTFACFVLFFIFCNGNIKAIEYVPGIIRPEEIKIMPTAIPTKILINPIKDININIKPLATNTPTPIVITQVVTATPNPTVSVAQTKPTETEKITLAPSPVETVTPEPTIEEVEKTEEKAEKTDSNMWFWVVIAGLMALILAMQIWSTKKNEKNQSKKENE